MTISSVNNERIKAAVRLQRRRYRMQSGAILIEGLRLVRDAWLSGTQPSVLFVEPGSISANPTTQSLVDEMRAAQIEVVNCTKPVFAKLAETVTPQGIAAVIPMPALDLPAEVNFVLLLDRVRDPGNAGTLLRSAEAAGVQLAIFCPETVDPFNDKVMRAAMGAHFRLPIRACATWPEVTDAMPAALAIFVADAGGVLCYSAVDWRQPAALIVGGEADGPTDAARAMATAIRIPMQVGVESLNAGVAGSVILFEASRQRHTVT